MPVPQAPFTPCIVFDTETTGFPGEKKGFRAQVIEVGAVVVTEDHRVVSPINFFVWHPAAHFRHRLARQAMRIHQITVADIQEFGIHPDHASERLVQWIERVQERHGVIEARAYNQGFDFWFLQREPWNLFERTTLVPGEDIKETSRKVMKAAGATKHAPPLAAAVSYLQERGYALAWEGEAHRAMEDARMAALCALCFQEESHRQGLETP